MPPPNQRQGPPPFFRYTITFSPNCAETEKEIDAHNCVVQGPMVCFIRMIAEQTGVTFALFRADTVQSVLMTEMAVPEGSIQ